jgi:hypothetical protein
MEAAYVETIQNNMELIQNNAKIIQKLEGNTKQNNTEIKKTKQC